MKSIRSVWPALVSSLIIFTHSGYLQAETGMSDHHHGHEQSEHATSDLSLNHGKKWKTDAPLRQGMQSISDAVMNNVAAYHHDKLTKADAEQLTRHINDQVNYLIANCKLDPGADATLHVLIGDLLTAASEVSKEPSSSQGMPHLVKTLRLYPDYFEHQGWNKSTKK